MPKIGANVSLWKYGNRNSRKGNTERPQSWCFLGICSVERTVEIKIIVVRLKKDIKNVEGYCFKTCRKK